MGPVRPRMGKWDALVMKMLAPVAAQIIRALAPRDGSEHLDIPSGSGEPGLSVALLIPRGRGRLLLPGPGQGQFSARLWLAV